MLQGYNATIFAYGQTGTGKTYTMIGGAGDSRGVIPRAVHHILQHVQTDPGHTYTVQVAFLQLYMEMLQDLLEPGKETPIRIREDPEEGIYLSGIKWVPVNTVKECMDLMAMGDRHRNTAFTSMNSHSSRSHAAFMIKLEKRVRYSREQIEELEKTGEAPDQSLIKSVLYLVDLAGSERVKKSKAVGSRLDEAKNINLALLALGNCIQALADKKAKFVPFRDSKLTRLLEDSLGGNSKTSLIVTIGPCASNVNETISSLQFGSRAMKVENRPEVNKIVDYRALCAQLQAELDQINDGSNVYLIHNQQLQEEVEALRTQVEQLQADKEELVTALEDAKRLMDVKGSKDVSVIENEKKLEVQRMQQHYQAKVQKQDEEHRKFLEEIDKLMLDQEKDVTQMKTQIIHQKSERSKLAKEITRLQGELEQERTDRDTRVAQITNELDELRSKLSTAEEEALTQKTLGKQLTSALQEKDANIKSLIGQLEETKNSASAEVQSIKQMLATSGEEQKRLKQLLVEKKKEWEAKVKNTAEEIGRMWQGKLEEVKKDAGEKISAKESEQRNLSSQITSLNVLCTTKDSELGKLRSDYDSKARETLKLVTVSEGLKRELDKVMASHENLGQQHLKLKERFSAKETECRDLMGKCRERDEQLEDCLHQIRDRDQRLAVVSSEIEATTRTSADLQKRLEQEIERLTTAHESEKSDLETTFKAQIARLHSEGKRQLSELEALEIRHKAESESLSSRHSAETKALKDRFEAEKQKLQEVCKSELQESEQKHKQELREMQTRTATDIENLKRQFQMISKSSDSKVEDLREELTRQRNAHIAEIESISQQNQVTIANLTTQHKKETEEIKREFRDLMNNAEAGFERKCKEMIANHSLEIEELKRRHELQTHAWEEELERLRNDSESKIKAMEGEMVKAEQNHTELLVRERAESERQKSLQTAEYTKSEKLKTQFESESKASRVRISDLQTQLNTAKAMELGLMSKQQQELAFMRQAHSQSMQELESKHSIEIADLEKYWKAQSASLTDLYQSETERTTTAHSQTVASLSRKLEETAREKEELREKFKADELRREEVIASLKQSQQSLLDSLSTLEQELEQTKQSNEEQSVYLQNNIESVNLKLRQERENATQFQCQVDTLTMEKTEKIQQLQDTRIKLETASKELIDMERSHEDELKQLLSQSKTREEEHLALTTDYQRAVSWYLVLTLTTEIERQHTSEELAEAQKSFQTDQKRSFSQIQSLESTIKTADSNAKISALKLENALQTNAKEREDFRGQVEDLKGRIQAKEIEVRGLQAQLDVTRDTSLTKSAELSEKLKEMQIALTTKELEIHASKSELQVTIERSMFNGKKQAEEIAKLEGIVEAKSAEVSSVGGELEKLKETASSQMLKATERLTQLQQSLRSKDNELSQLALDLKRVQETVNSQTENISHMKKSLSINDNENRQLSIKCNRLEEAAEVQRQETVRQVSDLHLQLNEKERSIKSLEAQINTLNAALDKSNRTMAETDRVLRVHLPEDFELITWLKSFLVEHKHSPVTGHFEFLSYLCSVYNKLQTKGTDSLQVHEFSRNVHDKFFAQTRTQVSSPRISRYLEASLTNLEKEMEITRPQKVEVSGSLRDISQRQQEAMKKKLKKAGKTHRETVTSAVEHLVLLTEMQAQTNIKGVKEALEQRKRNCDPVFSWEQLKTCTISGLIVSADPAAQGVLGQVVALKRLAISLTTLLCVTSALYSCMLSKRCEINSLHQDWVAEDRADLLHSLICTNTFRLAESAEWARRCEAMKQEQIKRFEKAHSAELQDSAARVIQRRWRTSKKREINQKVQVYEKKYLKVEEETKQLSSQLSQVSVQNGYLLIRGCFNNVSSILGDLSKSILDPANDLSQKNSA